MPKAYPHIVFNIVLLLTAAGTGNLCTAVAAEPTASDLEFFEKEVRPLLAKNCYSCHSAKSEKLQAGLKVDSLAALLQGGDSGAAIVPGDADDSLLIEAVRYESYEMPPKGKLPASSIKILERWVEMGAPWPKEKAPEATALRPEFDLLQRKKDHWVWQPVDSPEVPAVTDKQWPRAELDHFILARLEAAGLKPSRDAERAAVMRRLYFDLTGLPPTPEQAERYLADQAPGATARLVDELLNSPRFGERWGRHWLDLVRYAESRGHEFDNDAPNAFQYRDYIIRALNADVPYDQLVREHIAGDLLKKPRVHPQRGFNESILGTGFWFLGEWVHSPVDIRKDEADRFDNMVDVMSKTFLGVTVSCARCHDHKFDAISTADYYSLTGFLQSSDYRQVRFESLQHNGRVAGKLAELNNNYAAAIADTLKKHGVEQPQPSPLPLKLRKKIVVDYGRTTAEQYLQDGYLFGQRPTKAGEPYWVLENGKPALKFAAVTAAVSDPVWNGLESVSEKGMANRSSLAKIPRSGRTLRTPTFEVTDGNIACRVRGNGHVVACVDSHRLVAGPLHKQTIVRIKPGTDWTGLKLNRYAGHRIHLEFTPARNAQLEVSLVTQGVTPQEQKIFNRLMAKRAAAGEVYGQAAQRILDASENKIVKTWSDARKSLQEQIMQRSHLAMAMLDGTGEDAHVLIRGNSSKPGAVEPRHFLTAVAGGKPMPTGAGSGRLELAAQINDPGNPLTARVMVNRIWHHLMGRGIVPTTDDFGVLGQRPTHPALLDYLATLFLEDGRSIKKMIRRIVLSRTYQMSSKADAEAVAIDPNNLLWSFRPPQRLEGEAIRDALLLISGRLDATPFGEPVPVHLTGFMDGRGRPRVSGPLDGAGRRSVYIAVRRNFLSPFMLTFDTPAPFSTMGRRNVSNVPAQALILMNDPLVVQMAGLWAARAIKQHATLDDRINWMYQSAFARQPAAQEKAIATAWLKARAAGRNVDQDDPQLWKDLAHVLINTKEFIFLP